MNILTIETIEDSDIELKIPESLREITFDQLVNLQDAEITNFEAISVLSGRPVDDLYSARSYDDVSKMAKIYIDMFNYNMASADLQKMPKKVTVNYAGKRKAVNVGKYISFIPAGAYMLADKVISKEVSRHIDLYGEDTWRENFNPSLSACAAVVDAFLYCKVTGKPWPSQGRDHFAAGMYAADVLILAKHFFNAWPKLNADQPVSKITLIYKTAKERLKTFATSLKIFYPDRANIIAGK